MKRNLLSFLMTVGLGIIFTGTHEAKACKNDTFHAPNCPYAKSFTKGLRRLEIFEEPCKIHEKKIVNFVALGGTLGGASLKHFTHFTQPGEGLVLGCTKKGSGSSTTIYVRLTTDQNPMYNQTSADSKYPIWRAKASLPEGSYTGKLYVTENFEQTLLSSCIEKLTHSFKVCDNNDLVILAK